MDDPELESDDDTEAGIWKKRKTGERLQGEDEGCDRSSNTVDRSSNTVDGCQVAKAVKGRMMRKKEAGGAVVEGSGGRGGVGSLMEGRRKERAQEERGG